MLRNYWRLVERHRATSLQGVPTILAALAEVPLDGATFLAALLPHWRRAAAAELAARFERQFGLHVNESLGMTEMAGISSISPPGSAFPVNCVGFPPPHVQVRIATLDAAPGRPARDLPPGEAGMVLFKAPNVIPGFVDPADTAQAFTEDGWLISGDIGRLDEQGRLHLQGRAKDLIIRGGHNIDPKTIEDALASHPAVRLCAAVGAPDAYAGELPVAFVTLAEEARITEAELLAHAAATVDEAPARPRRVIVLEQMPMTNVGKIYKPDLRRPAVAVSVQALVAQSLRESGSPEDSPCLRVLTDAQPQVAVQALPDAPRPCGHGCARRWRGCPCPCRCLNEHGKDERAQTRNPPGRGPGPRRASPGDSRHVHAVPAPRPARRRPVRARRRPAGRRAKRLSRQAGHADRALPAAPPTATCASWRRTHPSTRASPSSWKTGRAPAARWGRPTWPRPPSRTATPFRCTPWPCCACLHAQDPLGSDQRFHLPHRPVGLYLRLHRARRFSVQNLQRLHRGRAQGPGSIDYGSTGAGSSPHLLMEEVARNAGVQLNHVPLGGHADMQQALLADT